MRQTKSFAVLLMGVVLAPLATPQAVDPQLALGERAIKSRTGCFLVDYSFVETEALKPGYVKDQRVYDANKDKSIKEWIFAETISPTRLRLQHVLLGVDLSGKVMQESLLKHTGEDWEYDAPYLYEYVGSSTWNVKSLHDSPRLWTRRITNLDDGLRYQCAAAWKTTTAYPDWTCNDLAPIPGRESRDMHRHDYQLLERSSRIIDYGDSWLEREANTKVIDENGVRTPLVKELGKTWYVRLPDAECSSAQDFVKPRLPFWKIERESWDQVLTGDKTFVELPPAKDQPSRYEQILDLEDEFVNKNLSDPIVAAEARSAILKVISTHRKP